MSRLMDNKVLYSNHANQKLTESEELLRKIFDSVNDVIYTISLEGKFLSLNSSFEQITGWRIEEWLGKPFKDIVHPDDLENAFIVFNKVILREIVNSHELRIKTKNGEYIITELNPSPLIINNVVIGLLGIARDISEKRKQENRLKDLYESVSVKTGMSYFSQLTDFCCKKLGVKFALIGMLSENKNLLQILSFKIKGKFEESFSYEIDIIGTPFEKTLSYEQFYYPENVQQFYPNNTFLKKYNISSYIGYPLIDRDNKVLGIFALMDKEPFDNIVDKEESIVFFLDRTANEIRRLLAEKKVKESEQFNKDILAALTSQLAVLDEFGNIVTDNDAWNNAFVTNDNNLVLNTAIGANYFTICETAMRNGDIIAEKALMGIKSVINRSEKKI